MNDGTGLRKKEKKNRSQTLYVFLFDRGDKCEPYLIQVEILFTVTFLFHT